MLVFEERGKPEYPEKNLSEQARKRTNNKLNLHMTPGPGIEPGTHWWEESAFTTAPSLRHPYCPKSFQLRVRDKDFWPRKIASAK